jgi:CRISPR/Cas system CSM-associated protein Csm3 (group 7 of RAMP superfamily)
MLFGTTAKEDKKKEESFTFKGKIRVLDATYSGIYDTNNKIINADPIITKYLRKHSLSNPKNHHENYYLNGNKIKGRKFYYHHKNDLLLDKKQEETILVEMIRKDSVFEFTIYFENLTKEEYGLLMTTLELEPGLGHKIGMGKPLGLGSCMIDVREIVEFSKNHYLSINNSGNIYNYENNNILDRKIAIKKEWKKGIPNDLRCILTLDNGFVIRYPDKNSGEFKKLKFHKPCEDFDRNPIKFPASAKIIPSNPAATSLSMSVQK